MGMALYGKIVLLRSLRDGLGDSALCHQHQEEREKPDGSI